jgi:hypothetical protein
MEKWGKEYTAAVCRVTIYVTDKDTEAMYLLKKEWNDSVFNGIGALLMDRPNFKDIIEEHTLNCITTSRNSHSLLAFCGSPALSRLIHQSKISNDAIANMTGNKYHQMEFVTESYGGCKTPPHQTKKLTGLIDEVTEETSTGEENDSVRPPVVSK